MIRYPEIDRYAALGSPIHRWDPRLKLVSILILIFSIVLLYDVRMAFIALIIATVLLLISRIPLQFVAGYLKWVSIFILPFFLIMPFAVQGNEIYRLHTIAITYEGVEYALLIWLRAFSAVMLIFPMIGTMQFGDTIKALESLRAPNKLVQMIMFTYRYIFVLLNELQTMLGSMYARGFQMKLNMQALRTTGKALGMLFVRSYERSERVYNAMISRGYTGRVRTPHSFKVHNMDWVKSLPVIGVAIGLHYLAVIL